MDTEITPAVVAENLWTEREFRAAARRAAGLRPRDNRPVEVVEGDAAPKVVGTEQHYETRGGSWVRHPSAYAKVGWSNLVYVPSTVRVRVGREWRPTV